MTASAAMAIEISDASVAVAQANIDYRTEPSRYHHWSLAFDGDRKSVV